MSKVWFTADQHFGHKNIIKYCKRPFSSVEEMDNEIIKRHNSVVSSSDFVFHLGDFALSEERICNILEKLNGKHGLVAGNHDKCFPSHRKYQTATQRYIKYGFLWVTHEPMYILKQPRVKICHFPTYEKIQDFDWYLHGTATIIGRLNKT